MSLPQEKVTIKKLKISKHDPFVEALVTDWDVGIMTPPESNNDELEKSELRKLYYKYNQQQLSFSKWNFQDKVEKEHFADKLNESKKEWRNHDYWKLPANIRKVIDRNSLNGQQSNFYYKLHNMNDRITIFNKAFNQNMPKHEQIYFQKKRSVLLNITPEQKTKHRRNRRQVSGLSLFAGLR